MIFGIVASWLCAPPVPCLAVVCLPAQVAVKELIGFNNSDMTESKLWQEMMNEVHFLGCLSHPNIMRFMAVCLDPPMIVMQYYPHGSLFDLLRKARGGNQRCIKELQWNKRLEMLKVRTQQGGQGGGGRGGRGGRIWGGVGGWQVCLGPGVVPVHVNLDLVWISNCPDLDPESPRCGPDSYERRGTSSNEGALGEVWRGGGGACSLLLLPMLLLPSPLSPPLLLLLSGRGLGHALPSHAQAPGDPRGPPLAQPPAGPHHRQGAATVPRQNCGLWARKARGRAGRGRAGRGGEEFV